MSEYCKNLTREDLLSNLYMRTNKKFPSNSAGASFVKIDFYQYSGLFYYYNACVRFEITEEILAYFSLTLEEMVHCVNTNTEGDFILLPTSMAGVYSLIDKNGDSVERILLNRKKIDTYLRTIDDGFGLEIYPAKYNNWYIVPASVIDDEEYAAQYRAFIKEQAGGMADYFYKIDSDGTIDVQTL